MAKTYGGKLKTPTNRGCSLACGAGGWTAPCSLPVERKGERERERQDAEGRTWSPRTQPMKPTALSHGITIRLAR